MKWTNAQTQIPWLSFLLLFSLLSAQAVAQQAAEKPEAAEIKSEPSEKANPENEKGETLDPGPQKSETTGEPMQKKEQSLNKQGKRTSKKQKKDFHAATPQSIANRLSVSTGASFGVGLSSDDDYSSDYLAYEVGALYSLQNKNVGHGNLTLVAGGKLASHTGIFKKQNADTVANRYLLRGGAEYQANKAKFRFGALLNLGLEVSTHAGFSTVNSFEKEYGFAAGIEAYTSYRVMEKVALQAGVDLSPLSSAWYGLTLGTSLSF